MKRSIRKTCTPLPLTALALAGTLLATSAQAQAPASQSNWRLYGVADASLRYLKGVNAANDSSLFMTDGTISQSRWGLTGKEDLGNGLNAIFALEGGYRLNTGLMQRDGRIFNRKAYVGLSGDFGELTMGVQNNPLWELLINGWDPLEVANYPQNEWMPVAFASNGPNGSMNTIKYMKTVNDIRVGLEYIVSDNMSSSRINSGWVASLSYVGQPLGVTVNALQSRDRSAFARTSYQVGFKYDFAPFRLTAGWYNSKDETGGLDRMLGENPLQLPNAPTLQYPNNARKDNAYYAGLVYKVTPPLTLSSAVYYSKGKNVAGVAGKIGEGSRRSYVLLAEYGLSRRTTVYGTVDYTRASGAQRAGLPNNKYQTGMGTGLRHRF